MTTDDMTMSKSSENKIKATARKVLLDPNSTTQGSPQQINAFCGAQDNEWKKSVLTKMMYAQGDTISGKLKKDILQRYRKYAEAQPSQPPQNTWYQQKDDSAKGSKGGKGKGKMDGKDLGTKGKGKGKGGAKGKGKTDSKGSGAPLAHFLSKPIALAQEVNLPSSMRYPTPPSFGARRQDTRSPKSKRRWRH
jgi:hypothetical protein